MKPQNQFKRRPRVKTDTSIDLTKKGVLYAVSANLNFYNSGNSAVPNTLSCNKRKENHRFISCHRGGMNRWFSFSRFPDWGAIFQPYAFALRPRIMWAKKPTTTKKRPIIKLLSLIEFVNAGMASTKTPTSNMMAPKYFPIPSIVSMFVLFVFVFISANKTIICRIQKLLHERFITFVRNQYEKDEYYLTFSFSHLFLPDRRPSFPSAHYIDSTDYHCRLHAGRQ